RPTARGDSYGFARFARVRAALRAAAERAACPRLCAEAFAWRDSARGDAAACPFFSSARLLASDRFRDGPPLLPRARSRVALRRVEAGTVPFSGTGSFT